jgi:hypothetical protein
LLTRVRFARRVQQFVSGPQREIASIPTARVMRDREDDNAFCVGTVDDREREILDEDAPGVL